jgi:hypothetical protein
MEQQSETFFLQSEMVQDTLAENIFTYSPIREVDRDEPGHGASIGGIYDTVFSTRERIRLP